VSQKRGAAKGVARTLQSSSAESPAADFAINARVRQVLTRRWVRRDQLEIGTTDGVVVLKGQIEREPAAVETEDPGAQERFLWRLRAELKAIPGVVDVVMDTDSTERTQAP
jgi:hypothetical protein